MFQLIAIDKYSINEQQLDVMNNSDVETVYMEIVKTCVNEFRMLLFLKNSYSKLKISLITCQWANQNSDGKKLRGVLERRMTT